MDRGPEIFEERKRREEAGEEMLLYAIEDTRIPMEFRDPLLEVWTGGGELTVADITDDTGGFSELLSPGLHTR